MKGKLIEIRTVWRNHRNLYLPLQKHTSRVIVLDTFPFPPLIGDAVITNLRGVEVGVRTADCAPVVLLGEEWAGVAHVGWRGLADHLEEREGRLFMDLQKAVLKELGRVGVPDAGLLERCTVCDEDLPSHRRDGSQERMLTSVRIL